MTLMLIKIDFLVEIFSEEYEVEKRYLEYLEQKDLLADYGY